MATNATRLHQCYRKRCGWIRQRRCALTMVGQASPTATKHAPLPPTDAVCVFVCVVCVVCMCALQNIPSLGFSHDNISAAAAKGSNMRPLNCRRRPAQGRPAAANTSKVRAGLGDSTSNVCPAGWAPLTRGECGDVALQLQMASEKTASNLWRSEDLDPGGCFQYEGRVFFNAVAGQAREGRRLVCKAGPRPRTGGLGPQDIGREAMLRWNEKQRDSRSRAHAAPDSAARDPVPKMVAPWQRIDLAQSQLIS